MPFSELPYDRPNEFDLYAIPDEFDLDEAVRILRSLLTEEGLEDIEDTSFRLHPYGCIDRESKEDSVGGCYDISENAIYIRTNYFPEDYAQRSRADKARIIKVVVYILAHEFWHRNERANIGFNDIINECHESRPKQTSHQFWGWITINAGESGRLSYLEELDSHTRQCMRDHPDWGHVFAGLEERFLDENNPDPVEPRDISSGSVWRGAEDFSWKWYKEFYAETPTRNTHFPQALENHYGRYFKDRIDFVRILRDGVNIFEPNNLFFDIYER